MIYAAGIDVGSTQTKGIIINDRMEIVAKSVDTNPDPKAELARLESS